MWRQADKNEIIIKNITDYGWKLTNNILEVIWDSEENVKSIQTRSALLLRGCKRKTGCITNRCRCMKDSRTCTEGCDCVGCNNMDDDVHNVVEEHEDQDTIDEDGDIEDDVVDEIDEGEDIAEDDTNNHDLMDWLYNNIL